MDQNREEKEKNGMRKVMTAVMVLMVLAAGSACAPQQPEMNEPEPAQRR